MELIITRNYKEMSNMAFERFHQIIKNRKNYRIGYATGSTPVGLYEKLVEAYETGNESFEHMNAYNLDEYLGLSKEDSQSYHNFLHKHLFSRINIKEDNIDIISHNNLSVIDECERYSNILENNPLDIQILGLGSNGHIGFNEPGSTKDTMTRIVELDQKTRQDNARMFSSINEVPTKAITVGIKDILNAKHIIVLVSGEGKSNAVRQMVEGPISPKCPASFLQLHDNVTVIMDKDAAQHII